MAAAFLIPVSMAPPLQALGAWRCLPHVGAGLKFELSSRMVVQYTDFCHHHQGQFKLSTCGTSEQNTHAPVAKAGPVLAPVGRVTVWAASVAPKVGPGA